MIASVARRNGLLGPLAITVWNDFGSADSRPTRSVEGVPFERNTGARWFGVGTFVIALNESEDTLFGRLTARDRTKCRQAVKRGARIEVLERPEEAALDGFFRLYGRMAKERGLERPASAPLVQAWEQGDLLFVRCRDSAEADLITNLIYVHPPHAYFLLGARAEDVPAGAGHFTQWETIRHLKARRFRWYDLGLVRTLEPDDGIFRFKKSLGGRYVSFGQEYQRIPRGLAAFHALYRGLREQLRRA